MNKDTQQHRLKKVAPLLNSIISVTASAAAAAICLAAQSEEPLETLIAFFISPFTNSPSALSPDVYSRLFAPAF